MWKGGGEGMREEDRGRFFLSEGKLANTRYAKPFLFSSPFPLLASFSLLSLPFPPFSNTSIQPTLRSLVPEEITLKVCFVVLYA